LQKEKYKAVKAFSVSGTKDKRSRIVEVSAKYLNSPYLWGGRSPFGIDCSGFTQIVYKIAGIRIPRDVSQQVQLGVNVDFVNEARPGDLAFFDDHDGKIIHTGIILEKGKIIHASGMVRIDNLDHEGINRSDNRHYTHHLRLVKNIIDHI
jgi:cell wall-associated NlpC family hydrolase